MGYYLRFGNCIFERIGEIMTELEILTMIYNDVHIIMVFVILNFATACMRGWRKNVVKGVR